VDDAAEFRAVLASMSTLQFAEATVRAIWRLLAGLLQLGNISFQEGDLQDSSTVTPASEQALLHCGELLGLGREAFRFCLTGPNLYLVVILRQNVPFHANSCHGNNVFVVAIIANIRFPF